MNRNTKCLAGLVVIILIGIAVLTLRDEGKPSLSSVEKWEVTLDLLIPDNDHAPCGFVTISFPENVGISPRDKLDEILGNFGESGQYVPGSNPVENTKENGRLTYRYEFGPIPTSPDIPPIRQDNSGENFCFYTNIKNIVLGGTPWWDRIGCDSLIFTLILPENYWLVRDITEPLLEFGGSIYKDNEFRVFTSAPELTKEVKDNRWTITASWEAGEFDKYNTDFYLEVHYENLFF
nr:hypothetical protein [Anaerolineae bacterium]